jgi:putative hydrolase of the HAD superfamily
VSPENYALYVDTLPVLERLKAMDFSQYIVSNNYPELSHTAAILGLAPYFSGIIVSGEIGYDKPRREIFEAALELAGRPGCCFFIGDNPMADGQGAAGAGIRVLLVHTREDPRGFPAFETLTQALTYVEGKIG